jgi:hypothetical protein
VDLHRGPSGDWQVLTIAGVECPSLEVVLDVLLQHLPVAGLRYVGILGTIRHHPDRIWVISQELSNLRASFWNTVQCFKDCFGDKDDVPLGQVNHYPGLDHLLGLLVLPPDLGEEDPQVACCC